jgi:hypothetical protein
LSDTDPYAGPNVYYPPAEVTVEEPVETADDSEKAVEELTAIETAPPVSDTEDEVPTGTIAEILAWVGTDRDRAARALAAEQAGQNRKSLLKNLTTGS